MKLISKIINRIDNFLENEVNAALRMRNKELSREIDSLVKDIASLEDMRRDSEKRFKESDEYIKSFIMEFEKRGTMSFCEYIKWHNDYTKKEN